MKQFLFSTLLFSLLLGHVGCSKLEVTAYRTIVGAKAFLDSEKQSHPQCGLGSNADPCPYLARATAAKDFLIDAAETYCSSPDFEAGGKCSPPTTKALRDVLSYKLQAAISNYNRAESDLKGVLK